MQRWFALTSALCFILVACSPCVFALDPSLDISQYAHTSWKIREGFTKGAIYSIAQTPDGYLWLGTEFGLLRFDGVRNVPWQPPGGQRLPPGRIRRLVVAHDGTLWIGTDGGLASWKSGQLIQYPELAGQIIITLLEDREGLVWAGSAGFPHGKLCAIQNGGVHCYGQDGSFGRAVYGLYEDGKGNLWAGVADGLWKWKPGPPKFYSLPDTPDGIQAFAEDTDGTLLVGWNGGIYRFVDGRTEAYALRGVSRPFRETMLRDRDGGLWIGTHDRGLIHVHQGMTDVLSPSDGLSGGNVYALFEDREGTIWVSTIDGLDRFREFAVATLTANQGLSNPRVGSIVADKDGSVWLGTYGGLNRWDHGQIAIPATGYGKRDGKLDGANPGSLFQDDRGRIWVSTLGEFGYLEDGRFTSIKGVPGGNMLSITQDTAENLWVANESAGLFRISPHDEAQEITWADLGHKDYASVLAADRRQGGLWIGFFLGGMAYFSNGQIRASYTAKDGLGAGRVSDFLSDDDGTLWISTAGGLSRLKNNHLATLNSRNGLPCDAVHWAVEGDDRSMWMYTACGLIRIVRSELDQWAAAADKSQNTSPPIRFTVFDSSDGVRSLFSPGHYHPQVARTPDGRLWFLPWDSVSVIDPSHLPFNKLPPPVHIEQITADRKSFDASGNLRLPPLVRDLEVDYTALSLVIPERVLFRYKLEGFDRDWQDVGNRRQAFYTNLPPRTYRFRVIACNNSGVWNETGDSFEFSIAPAYYQTTWFKVLCAAAFLAVLGALYLLRLQQLRHQFTIGLEARVNERTRVARELHDTLLQSFQGAVFQFQAARRLLLRNADNAMQVIDEAIQAAEEGITEGRAAINDLRPEPAAQRDLPELLKASERELADTHQGNGSAPTFGVIVEGKRRDLAIMVQDEVYRISREVIRNAFAHAVASHIEVEIRYDRDQLRVRIRDDGKGIDPRILEGGGRPGHWGISGMRERAQRIGSRLDFWSEVGAGTEVQLTVPAAMAYEKRRHHRRFQWFRKAGSDEQRS